MQGVITWPFALRLLPAESPADGADAMNAISWVIYGKHGNTPECVCPVIAAYVAGDAMYDNVRQRLLPFLPRIAGSRSKPHEAARLRLLRLAAIRVYAPRALDAAGIRAHATGLHEHAAKLRALPDDVDMEVAAAAAFTASEAAEEAQMADWRSGVVREPRAKAALACAWFSPSRAARMAMAPAEDVHRCIGPLREHPASGPEPFVDEGEQLTWSWDDYFDVLDAVLNAGPQGAPWSADAVDRGVAAFASAGGVALATA